MRPDIPYEPDHEKRCLTSYANNKGADQPARPHSLISAFVVHCLDRIISLVSVTKISSLMLASVAEQASLRLTWSETPEDTFSRGAALMYYIRNLMQNLILPVLRKKNEISSSGNLSHLMAKPTK